MVANGNKLKPGGSGHAPPGKKFDSWKVSGEVGETDSEGYVGNQSPSSPPFN